MVVVVATQSAADVAVAVVVDGIQEEIGLIVIGGEIVQMCAWSMRSR